MTGTERYLNADQVANCWAVSPAGRSTRLMRDRNFPAGVKIGGATRWLESEIHAWVRAENPATHSAARRMSAKEMPATTGTIRYSREQNRAGGRISGETRRRNAKGHHAHVRRLHFARHSNAAIGQNHGLSPFDRGPDSTRPHSHRSHPGRAGPPEPWPIPYAAP